MRAAFAIIALALAATSSAQTCTNGGKLYCCQATVAGELPVFTMLAGLINDPYYPPSDINCVLGKCGTQRLPINTPLLGTFKERKFRGCWLQIQLRHPLPRALESWHAVKLCFWYVSCHQRSSISWKVSSTDPNVGPARTLLWGAGILDQVCDLTCGDGMADVWQRAYGKVDSA